MNLDHKNVPKFACRHILLYIQMLCFCLLILSDYLTQGLVQNAYCIVVLTSPMLMFVYYGQCAKDGTWSWAELPVAAEFMISILFVGTMIYGIRLGGYNSVIFMRLLIAYVFSAVLSALGYWLAPKI